MEEDWKLSVTHSYLPSPLDTTKKGVRISGSNHSDDLFMYLTKKVNMQRPDQLYKGTFEVQFATNAAEESVGVGGSPAHSVYMGIGLASIEPKKVLDSTDGHYRMNISKISQSQDGEDMKHFKFRLDKDFSKKELKIPAVHEEFVNGRKITYEIDDSASIILRFFKGSVQII